MEISFPFGQGELLPPTPLPGFALADMKPLYGDELGAVMKWKTGSDLTAISGKPIRLHFKLKDTDIFALRFAE